MRRSDPMVGGSARSSAFVAESTIRPPNPLDHVGAAAAILGSETARSLTGVVFPVDGTPALPTLDRL